MNPPPRPDVRFTIEELADQAARALEVGYDGPADARARAVPDLRTLRYYATLGLLDRPVELRGRTALYARRHLLQIVAIKRLQADGLALAEIRAELLGITDTRLERVARVSAAPPSRAPRARSEPPVRSRRPSSIPVPALAGAWDVGRSALLPAAPPAAAVAASRNAPASASRASGVPDRDVIAAIRLAHGVTLLVDTGRAVPAADVAALRAAAAPLMSALAERGLVLSLGELAR